MQSDLMPTALQIGEKGGTLFRQDLAERSLRLQCHFPPVVFHDLDHGFHVPQLSLEKGGVMKILGRVLFWPLSANQGTDLGTEGFHVHTHTHQEDRLWIAEGGSA
jgi:hypothetical protein